MPSTSERTFGQRYTKGRDLVTYLQTLPAYAPGNPDLEPANLTTLLDEIDVANSVAASSLSTLNTERYARLVMYKGDDGIIKRTSRIRDFLGATLSEGKKARDFKKVQKAVQQMRGQRLSAKPPAASGKTVSTSEQSYGSILKQAKDVLEVIKQVAGYSPSNPHIQILNLETFLNDVDTKNTLVAQRYEEYDNAVEDRKNKYDELADRVTKIKLALAAQYGKDSNEYKDSVKY